MVTTDENASDQSNSSGVLPTSDNQYLVFRRSEPETIVPGQLFNPKTGVTILGEAAALGWIPPTMPQMSESGCPEEIRLWYTAGWTLSPTGDPIIDTESVTVNMSKMTGEVVDRGRALLTQYLKEIPRMRQRSTQDIISLVATAGDLIATQVGLPARSVAVTMRSIDTMSHALGWNTDENAWAPIKIS
ncbi:hypothetical protein M231_00324 [Tremella mesenterica]|uniref:Uncharacterized protein n=1 Tax=Tremella mesenterica TaxID=5217 RepID=A0A4Q1BW00_TREME|nr:hypothetical protein M231_00324 [Tremella mesenterica]